MVGKSFNSYKPNGTRKSRTLTFILVGIGAVLLIGPFLLGINNRPPGLLVSYVGSTALFAAFVHRWREAKQYLFPVKASLIGFALFVVLHGLFDALGEKYADVVVVGQLLAGLSVASFLAAIFVCPPGFFIGAVGALVLHLREKLTA